MNNFKRIIHSIFPAFLLSASVGQIYAFTNFATEISSYTGVSANLVQFAFSLGIFFLGMGAAFFGKIVAHIAETSPDILQRARLLIKLGRKDEAVLLLGKKLDEWKTEMKKRDSGYYSAQPAYLSYLEPSAADRKRRFGPLIKEAEKIMEEIGQSR